MGAAAREVEAGRGNEEAEIATENGGLAETDTETAKIADKDEAVRHIVNQRRRKLRSTGMCHPLVLNTSLPCNTKPCRLLVRFRPLPCFPP